MEIPVVDLCVYKLGKDNVSVEQLEKLGQELRSAFTEVGFVYVKNTGITQEESFFDLPEDVKKPFRRGTYSCDINHGWVSLETERHNWPSDGIEDFRDVHISFFLSCKELSLRVLRIMALGLGLQPETFLNAHKHIGSDLNKTTLRTLFYPPVETESVKKDQLRCGEHSDYGSITLVFQSSKGGLQVLNRAGEYISAPSIPGTVLINIADLMQRWTSDVYVSAVHRVLLPPPGDLSSRQSLAFFVQPDDEAVISCCDGSDKYPPVRSIDYLLSRFSESYGKK
ncbi:hypothetical protein DNTS_008817 [Danionella cerebrum]|uniref:Fe2OG dioxygenase domain-containing protein n=1 Tax=Danionella cerebrum TaxID=2873325 RepID=A0A553R1A7_9TELE|nr:hypothetical protein DNTS_008817 [Danionella translucida]